MGDRANRAALARDLADVCGLSRSEELPHSFEGDCPFCKAPKCFALTSSGGGFWNCTRCDAAGTNLNEFVPPKLSTEFVSVTDLENRPKPVELVQGILPMGSLACIYGTPGSGKTFVVLDWTLCDGTGEAWAHKAVRPGRVVYISGEGAAGLGARISAWRSFHGRTERVPAVHFVLDAVNLLDHGAVRQFVADVEETFSPPPSFVVIDTLARSILGGEENSAKDVGLAIAGADIVRHALGCTVLLVHHSNKSGESERGSTALRGAVDVLMSLKSDDAGLTLKCEKSKDAEAFPDIALALKSHLQSVVVTPNEGMIVSGFRLGPAEVLALKSLSDAALSDGLTVTKWHDLSDQPSATFYRARKVLCDKGFVERDREERGARYTVTELGQKALTLITLNRAGIIGDCLT